MKIVLDANGLDLGVNVAYNAAAKFVNNYQDVQIILVGNFDKSINKHPNIQIIYNPNKPSNPRNIRASLKENNSMNAAINIINENKADGVISGGDSGSYIAALTFKLKRIDNVSRPAFMPIITCLNDEKLLLLDVGANLEVKSEYLYEWAKLASAFHTTMFNKQNPTVSLLNVGVEEYKGLQVVREAQSLIESDQKLNYIGFSETRNLLAGNINVGLIDGYGGNLVIKSYEGAVISFKQAIKQRVKQSFFAKLGALLLKPSFKKIAQKLDFRNVSNAWVLGINALALKIHGAADELSIYIALKQMHNAISKDLLNKLKVALNV
ncbi:phosphate acyltransferase PlsX [Mycoplasma sp. 4423]